MRAWRICPLSQVEHLAAELDVEVIVHVPEEPVAVECDSRRVERILRNLLANAIDHSEGNPVTVDIGATEDAVGIAVTDSGVGLKEGQEELVFNRFWRADSSRKRHSGGTGLGLAIAREDAVLHGGTLDAIGYFGVGSRFRLILPRTPDNKVESEPIALEVPGAPGQVEAEEQSALEVTSEPGVPVFKGESDTGIVWPSERESRGVDTPFNHNTVPDFEEEAQR